MVIQLLYESGGFTSVTNGVYIQMSTEASSGPSSTLVLTLILFLKQDSPINKLLYARDIPRYKQMVERWVQIK